MASSVEAERYLEGSGVPVGWNEGAVALSAVPLFDWPPAGVVATGAMVGVLIIWILDVVRFLTM